MRSPEEQRASDDAFHALTVHCWNTCPSDGHHEAICYDLRAEACRAALRERDARLKDALDHLVPHGTSAGRMDLYGQHREGCASDYKEISCSCGLIQSKAHFHIALTALRALL